MACIWNYYSLPPLDSGYCKYLAQLLRLVRETVSALTDITVMWYSCLWVYSLSLFCGDSKAICCVSEAVVDDCSWISG